MTVFQSKNRVGRIGKQEHFTRETILLIHARTVRKDKAHLELILASDVKHR